MELPENPVRRTVPVTAIVPGWKRPLGTLKTVRRIAACDPAPAEIIVHLDGGCEFPLPKGVKVIRSVSNLGPGGARNLMIEAASHDLIASFDDDSYPEDADFFARVIGAAARHPEAGLLACRIRHRDSRHDAGQSAGERRLASFVGCGCIFRKKAFTRTTGFVPLPVAYGMEEVDLSIRLFALGIPIIEVPDLRVYHDTDLKHHESPRITAGSIKNQALLAWLRYPIRDLSYGALQWAHKAVDNLGRGRISGTVLGVACSALHVWRHRALRRPVPAGVVKRFRSLQRAACSGKGITKNDPGDFAGN